MTKIVEIFIEYLGILLKSLKSLLRQNEKKIVKNGRHCGEYLSISLTF